MLQGVIKARTESEREPNVRFCCCCITCKRLSNSSVLRTNSNYLHKTFGRWKTKVNIYFWLNSKLFLLVNTICTLLCFFFYYTNYLRHSQMMSHYSLHNIFVVLFNKFKNKNEKNENNKKKDKKWSLIYFRSSDFRDTIT